MTGGTVLFWTGFNQKYDIYFAIRFDFFSVDHKHVMAVARGPLSDCSASYKQLAGWDTTLLCRETAEQKAVYLAEELPESTLVKLSDLLT